MQKIVIFVKKKLKIKHAKDKKYHKVRDYRKILIVLEKFS